jgi:hypothetical protein
MKTYPLEIENCGEDTYILRSKGHHDPDEFMRAVRADGYDWPMGYPRHVWCKTVPVPSGNTDECGYYDAIYAIVPQGARGSYPITISQEAAGERLYEAVRDAMIAARESK